MFKRVFFIVCFLIIIFIIKTILFYPIFISNSVIIEYGIKPFDICKENPEIWEIIKKSYIINSFFSNIIISNFIYSLFFKNNKKEKIEIESKIKSSELNLLIGLDERNNKKIYIPEKGLYQNFLITGTIGTGKTSSAMYPFSKQLLEFNSNNLNKKIGMLILDVKGNYYKQIKEYCKNYNLEEDLIVIELGTKVTYNPLNKPNLKPQVLANRLKIILTLFSENNSESYWLDKAEQVISESIKLCRLYNNKYVTFEEIHKLITKVDYFNEKVEYLRKLFISNKLKSQEIYDLNSSIDFFKNEFFKLDERTISILKSEITRITSVFVSDLEVRKTFCPLKQEQTFDGFTEVIRDGKIVVLNLNISEYRNLSKIIAAYLKLDFQTEIMNNLSKNNIKTTAFICDEYAEYVTKTDSEFFSLSREAKCINIVSVQSYSSIKQTLKDEATVKVIVQNLINKIWYRTDDIFTIEEVQKQIGKEDKTKVSKTISENARETRFSYITNTLNSQNSSISESYNTYSQSDYIYDTNFLTQQLETFSALTFLSDGNKIIKPCKLKMFPYFLN